MKKAVIILVLPVLLILMFLSSGVYSVSTDKSAYAVGEPVKIRWSEIKLFRCSSDPGTEIYLQQGDEWKRINNILMGFGGACVDGKASYKAMPADVAFCSAEFLAKQGEYTWNGKFYDYKGSVDTCKFVQEGPKGSNKIYAEQQVNGTFDSYEYVDAPAGVYKVKLGGAESFFEIK